MSKEYRDWGQAMPFFVIFYAHNNICRETRLVAMANTCFTATLSTSPKMAHASHVASKLLYQWPQSNDSGTQPGLNRELSPDRGSQFQNWDQSPKYGIKAQGRVWQTPSGSPHAVVMLACNYARRGCWCPPNISHGNRKSARISPYV